MLSLHKPWQNVTWVLHEVYIAALKKKNLNGLQLTGEQSVRREEAEQKS